MYEVLKDIKLPCKQQLVFMGHSAALLSQSKELTQNLLWCELESWKNSSCLSVNAWLKRKVTKKVTVIQHLIPYVEFNEVSWFAFLCLNMFLHCQDGSLSGEIWPIDTSGWGNRIQDAGLKVAFKES